MAIEKTYLLGKNITLGCGFDLQAKAPLDSRQVVPEYDGLQALIDGNAAYEGMIVYDEGTKKTYQAQLVDGVLAFREFGINEAELKDLIASETTAAMEFKGAATALPTNPSKGDFYKVTASFDVAEGETAKVGDSIVYDGAQWFLIPSGDDIEDTWRPVTDVDNDATLTFAAGDKLDVAVASNGTVTYSHEEIAAPTVKKVGDDEGDETTRTYIASIETDGFGHITGYKTATETVEDTNTTYEFEGLPVVEGEGAPSSVYFQVKANDADAAEVIYIDAYSKNEADAQFVAKEVGKSLISDTEIARLAEVDNYDDEEIRGLIDANAQAIEDQADILAGKFELPEGVTINSNKVELYNKTYRDEENNIYDEFKTTINLNGLHVSYTDIESDSVTSVDFDLGNGIKLCNVSAPNDLVINSRGITHDGTNYAFPTDEARDGTFATREWVEDKKYETADDASAKLTEAKGYTDTEVAKDRARLDVLEGVKHSHENSEVLDGITAEKVSAWDSAEQNAKDYADDVKDELTLEIDKKVDKVEGKDLIATSEIERLATLANYDDTQVKADIAKKADADTMTTELGKKVDKVTGYSLVSDTEIARLAEVDNYDDTAVRGLIKDNADAIDVIEADYLKAEDKTELSNAIALKADKSVVDAMYTNGQIDGFLNGKVDKTAYEADKETFALKSEITSLAGKADKSYVEEELAKKVNVADYNTDKATFALKTDLNAYRTSADQDVIDQDFEGRIAELEAIDHDKLAKDASAAAVATVLDGAPAKFDTLKEIAAWIAEADTAEDAASLVTRVSALEAIDHEAYVDADAELKTELEGKINAINNHSHSNKDELDKITDGDVAKWNNEIGAKELATSKTTTAEVKEQIEAYKYATEADLTLAEGRITALEGVKDDYKAADATLKSELQKEIDDDVKALADGQVKANTEAISANAEEITKKANSADVYAKTETYTKAEVDALLTWGEF